MTAASKQERATVALNRAARHEYAIEETYEAGLALTGWEVRALRENRCQLKEAYVVLKEGEAWLLGSHIAPLPSASTHVHAEPTRTRKLLLHRRELANLVGLVERRGYALIPLALYWKRGRAKLEVGLAKGKKQHDKRAAEREKDWQRERARALKAGSRG